MRTHLLSDLDVAGREIVLRIEPQFDFYRIVEVRSASIDFARGPSDRREVTLELVMEYQGASGNYIVPLRLEGVVELALPEMRGWLHLPELEIEDVRDRQLEGVRYEVIAQFDRSFRCLCRSITVLGCDPM